MFAPSVGDGLRGEAFYGGPSGALVKHVLVFRSEHLNRTSHRLLTAQLIGTLLSTYLWPEGREMGEGAETGEPRRQNKENSLRPFRQRAMGF